MSVVHVNSISGITSITTPSSSDVLTLHTSNNAERFRIASNGTATATGTSDGVLQLDTSDSRGAFVRFGQGGSYHHMVGCADGLVAGPDKEDLGIRAKDNMVFCTDGANERLRIDSSGRLRIGNTTETFYSAADNLVVGTGGGSEGITIYSSSSDGGFIAFADGTSDPAYRMGQIIYDHSGNEMLFRTNGNNNRLTIKSDGKATFTEVTTSAGYDLSAISATAYNSSNVVDVCVYDTSKDTDGGEWRKKCGNTSWYNETFSATRGSKKEFPAVAVIVLVGGTVSSYGTDNNTQKILIYDGDDPTLPLWMAFHGHADEDAFIRGAANYAHTSVDMFNGQMVVGRNGGYGISVVNFIHDRPISYWDAAAIGYFDGNISCLLYTSPSPRDKRQARMPSSA